MKPTQFPQSQFFPAGGAGGPVVITCATVPTNGSNLTIKKARIMVVGPLNPYNASTWSNSKSKSQSTSRTTSLSQHGGALPSYFFSFTIVDHTGVGDVTCWDGGRYGMIKSLIGQCVQLLGMSSKPKTQKDVRFSRGVGDNMLHCNAGPFSMNPLEGLSDDIPEDNAVPVEWLNTRERIAIVLETRFGIRVPGQTVNPSLSGGAGETVGDHRMALMTSLLGGSTSPDPLKPHGTLKMDAPCCSNPKGYRCKTTGEPHPSRCMVCGYVINTNEPFCSESDPPGPCIAEPRGGMMRFRQGNREEQCKRAREPIVHVDKDHGDTEGEEDNSGGRSSKKGA